MLRLSLLLLAGTTCGAFNAPATSSRRSVLAAGAAAAFGGASQAALAVGSPKDPYQCREYTDCGVNAAATARLTATPGQGEAAGIRFGGTYKTEQGPVKITLAGSNAIITGTEDGKKWKLKAKFAGKQMLIDFKPKGGDEVLVKWNGLGLAFPDGSVWTKM